MSAMKHRIHIAATAVLLSAWVPAQAGSELEQLRALVAEQERQIRMLEEENHQLRVDAAPRGNRNAPAAAVNLVSMPNAATPTTPPAAAEEYTVVAGDNLVRIGRKFGASADAIAKANGIGPDMIIRPGQKLKIPSAASPRPAATPSAPVRESSLAHTVVAGETFYSISRQHHVAVDRLMAANPDTKPSSLRVGQKIRIPQPSAAEPTAAAPAAAGRAPSSPDTQQPPAGPAPEKRRPVRTMTIDGEMSYGAFASKHGTTPERLNQLNGLDLDARTILAMGSELYVPAQP